MGDTFIIAEAGLSFAGDLDHAKDLAKAAKEVGASAVKWQTFFGKFPDLKQYELSKQAWRELFETCDAIGIKWFSTPFDFEAIDFLADCGMDIWKIPSGMVTNEDFLIAITEAAIRKQCKLFISSGLSTIEEIEMASYVIAHVYSGKPHIPMVYFMHCVTAYPTLYEEMNLNVFRKGDFDGLSDHTLGIEIPIAAVALGASIIEKHFCLSRKGKGPDDHMSLEPHEFKEMVRCIRNVELAMGDGIKRPTPSELKVRDEIRGRMLA